MENDNGDQRSCLRGSCCLNAAEVGLIFHIVYRFNMLYLLDGILGYILQFLFFFVEAYSL
jgi:hypothetical protein